MDSQHCNCMNCLTAIESSAEAQTPIDVQVHACLGDVEVCCQGKPATVVTDCKDGCKLLVIQRLNMRIPLCYEVTVRACESEIKCAEDC